MTSECLICHRFQPVQLDLDGAEVPNYLYVCFSCKPKTGVIVLCKDDNQRLDITDDEAKEVFHDKLSRMLATLVVRGMRSYSCCSFVPK